MTALLLTVAAVAEDLAVSTRTVLRWIHRGDLRAVRLPGGTWSRAKRPFSIPLIGRSWRGGREHQKAQNERSPISATRHQSPDGQRPREVGE
jgi:excisionase family DNA binding protein